MTTESISASSDFATVHWYNSMIRLERGGVVTPICYSLLTVLRPFRKLSHELLHRMLLYVSKLVLFTHKKTIKKALGLKAIKINHVKRDL